jgi:hypothetical protein
MKFMLTYALKQETRNAAIARFLKTGAQPSKGVSLLGRWHRLDMSGGFLLLESTDSKAMAKFSSEWSDVCDLAVVPVNEDAELGEVLGALKIKKK